VNLTRTLVFSLVILIGSSCHRRAAEAEPIKEEKSKTQTEQPEEMGGAAGVEETLILGKIIERSVDAERFEGDEHPCDSLPCEAMVEIIAIPQIGSDFHGQFEEGEVIEVHFDLTLEPTSDLFPELNLPLSGLQEGDYFKAPLRQSTITNDPDRFRVTLYEKLK
jgi:hypothetical protein